MSDLRSLLVHVDGSPHSTTRVHVAATLAETHAAAVTAIFAEPAEAADMPYGYSAGGAAAMALQDIAFERRLRARSLCERALGHLPQPARWAELNGEQPAHTLARHAYCADLLVLGQHEGGVSQAFVEQVLLESGRPALLLPPAHHGKLVLDTVVVAWKPSAECARAVTGALPLLQQARSVLLTSWAEEPLPMGGHADIGGYLAAHGVQAVVRREPRAPRDIGAALRQLCQEVQAGLLVMGCYSRPRLRERVLGGATRSLLHTMPLPLLMSH